MEGNENEKSGGSGGGPPPPLIKNTAADAAEASDQDSGDRIRVQEPSPIVAQTPPIPLNSQCSSAADLVDGVPGCIRTPCAQSHMARDLSPRRADADDAHGVQKTLVPAPSTFSINIMTGQSNRQSSLVSGTTTMGPQSIGQTNSSGGSGNPNASRESLSSGRSGPAAPLRPATQNPSAQSASTAAVRRKGAKQKGKGEGSRGSLYELARDGDPSAVNENADPTAVIPISMQCRASRTTEIDEAAYELRRSTLRSGLVSGHGDMSQGDKTDGKYAATTVRRWLEKKGGEELKIILSLLPFAIALLCLIAVTLAYCILAGRDSDELTRSISDVRSAAEQLRSVRAVALACCPGTGEPAPTSALVDALHLRHDTVEGLVRGTGEAPAAAAAEAISAIIDAAYIGLGSGVKRSPKVCAAILHSASSYSAVLAQAGLAAAGAAARRVESNGLGSAHAQGAPPLYAAAVLNDAAAALGLAEMHATASTLPSGGDGWQELSRRVLQTGAAHLQHWRAQQSLAAALDMPDFSALPLASRMATGPYNWSLSWPPGAVSGEMTSVRDDVALVDRRADAIVSAVDSDVAANSGYTDIIMILSITFGLILAVTTAVIVKFLLRGLVRQRQAMDKELRDRIEVEQMVAHFVPAEFLALLNFADLTHVRVGHRMSTHITILFSDIRNFTAFSLTMTNQQTFDWLNKFFSRMNPVIRQNRGFVDKYLGDGIMALFTQPSPAVAASIQMQEALLAFNNQQRKLDSKNKMIRMGIGVHTGEVCVGTIGSSDRIATTIISDNVNVCSRVEALTKHYGCAIFITQDVFDKVNLAGVAHRCMGTICAKGLYQPVMLYDVFEADPPEDRAHKENSQDEFEEAVRLYSNGNWHAAEAAFTQLIDAAKSQRKGFGFADIAYSAKRDFVRRYKQEGVPFEDWHGEDVWR